MEGIAGSRRHHKPVKSNITEVRQQPLATLIVAPIASHHIHYRIFIHFFVLFNVFKCLCAEDAAGPSE